MDGVNLDRLVPGSIRNVSPSIAAWLIAEGYADAEMRMAEDEPFSADDRPVRRHDDTP
jgi:hypothetical protein